MDIFSIINNALSNIIASLVLILLGQIGKQLYTWIKHRAKQSEILLDETLRNTHEYEEVLSQRKSYRIIGYMFLIWACIMLATLVAMVLTTKKFDVSLQWIIFTALLFCEVPLALFVGYSPISSQEIEQKRQKDRAKLFKQAQGATPYSYILSSIIFPSAFLLYIIVCVVGLILIFLDPFALHLSLFWKAVAIGITILGGSYAAYLSGSTVYNAVKNLKHVPYQKKKELQKLFLRDEFKQ